MRELDFLREAQSAWLASIDAFDRSEEASSERLAAAAQTLTLISLAQDVRRIADALERQVTEENLAESVRIFGVGLAPAGG